MAKKEFKGWNYPIDKILPVDPPPGTVYFLNDDYMILAGRVFIPNIWQRIQHFFGHHFYTWDFKGCIYPDCKHG